MRMVHKQPENANNPGNKAKRRAYAEQVTATLDAG